MTPYDLLCKSYNRAAANLNHARALDCPESIANAAHVLRGVRIAIESYEAIVLRSLEADAMTQAECDALNAAEEERW